MTGHRPFSDLRAEVAARRDQEAAWLDWRRGGIGASDVPAIAGLSPYGSPWSVWATKRDLLITPETESMRFGKDIEPIIARWFTRETDLYVVGAQTMCVHPVETWARCTVDGFVTESPDAAMGIGPMGLGPVALPDEIEIDALGVYEAKYTSTPAGEIPLNYVAQCQWQMFVTGMANAWVAVMSLAFGRPSFRVYEVERDETAIGRLVAICREFWFDHVLTGTPPPIDASPATSEAIREAFADPTPGAVVDLDSIHSTVVRLVAMRRNRAQIDTEIAEAENTIRAALGDATEGWIAGQLVVSWRPQARHTIDAKRLRAAHPDIASEFTNESTGRVLRLHTKEDDE